jgi:hypothetical protein
MLIQITIKELSVPHRKHSAQQFKCQAVKNVERNYGLLLNELNKKEFTCFPRRPRNLNLFN